MDDLRAHLGAHPDLVAECSRRIRVLRVNRRTLELFAADSRDDLVANLDQVFRDDMFDKLVDEMCALWDGHNRFATTTVNYALTGRRLDIQLHGTVLPGYEDTWERVLLSIEDVSEVARTTRALVRSESYARGLFEHSPVSLWVEDFSAVKARLDEVRALGIVDFRVFLDVHPEFILRCLREVRVMDVNQQTLKMFAAPDKDTLLARLSDVFRDDMRVHFAEQLVDLWEGRLFQRREVVNYSLNGDAVDVHLQFSVLPGYEDTWELVLVSLTDITARKKAEAYLEFLGKHDVLTQLRNRSYFEEDLARLERNGPYPVSVVMVDLNGLKDVNDTLGMRRVTRCCVARVRSCARRWERMSLRRASAATSSASCSAAWMPAARASSPSASSSWSISTTSSITAHASPSRRGPPRAGRASASRTRCAWRMRACTTRSASTTPARPTTADASRNDRMRLPPKRLVRVLWPYIALWLAVVTAIGAFSFHEIRSTRDRELANGRVEAENLARVLQEQVTRSVEGVTRTLGLLRIVHQSTHGATKLAGFTDPLVALGATDIERRVLRYDRDGWLVDATDPEVLRVRRSAADLPWFIAARERTDGRIVIDEPRVGRVSGKLTIPMAVRLTDANGEFDGVLVTALDPERLVQLFRALRVGERSVVGIMGAGELLYGYSASADARADAAASTGQAADRTASAERRVLQDVADPAGIVARSAVPGTELTAFAALSEHKLLGDWEQYTRTIAGFALLTLVALSLPILLVARRALREVRVRSVIEAGYVAERVQARTDALTGVANRRAFEDALAASHADLLRVRQPFVMAYIDVDRFKKLNDTQGHAVGDRALKRIAQTLGGGVRHSDVIARLGGDEFAILMPNADARAMRRPFDAMFTALTVAVASEGWPISFSVGVIAFEDAVASAEEAGDLVDKLMYAVKASGRNGVRFAVWRDGHLHPDVGPRLGARVD